MCIVYGVLTFPYLLKKRLGTHFNGITHGKNIFLDMYMLLVSSGWSFRHGWDIRVTTIFKHLNKIDCVKLNWPLIKRYPCAIIGAMFLKSLSNVHIQSFTKCISFLVPCECRHDRTSSHDIAMIYWKGNLMFI